MGGTVHLKSAPRHFLYRAFLGAKFYFETASTTTKLEKKPANREIVRAFFWRNGPKQVKKICWRGFWKVFAKGDIAPLLFPMPHQ